MGESILVRKGGGVELTGNAATGDVLSGQTFYSNNASSKLTGTLALTGNAIASEVFSGKTFYSNNAKTRLTGTFVFDGNAATTDVSTGKTFYATNGTKLTGTGALATIDGVDQGKMFITANSPAFSGQQFTVVSNNGFVYVGTQNASIGLIKYNATTLDIVNNINQGSTVPALAVNNGFVYAAGVFSSGAIRKYHESNMTLSATSGSFDGTATRMRINNGFIYLTGVPIVVGKYNESTLSRTSQSGSSAYYGTTIKSIAINNGFVYVTGDSQQYITKFHESNLNVVGNSPNVGFSSDTLEVHNGVIYVASAGGGGLFTYHEGNLALRSTIFPSNSRPGISGVRIKNNFLYVFGFRGVIEKYHLGNLALVGFSETYGSTINSLNIDDSDFMYCVGQSPFRVSKFLQNTSFANVGGVNYYLVPK
jgi:hypothetical protein